MVDEVADASDVVLGEIDERVDFLEILPKDAVGILNGVLSHRVVRVREIAVGSKGCVNGWVSGELASVVERDGLDDILEREQLVDYGRADDVGLDRGHEFCPQEAGHAVGHSDFSAIKGEATFFCVSLLKVLRFTRSFSVFDQSVAFIS